VASEVQNLEPVPASAAGDVLPAEGVPEGTPEAIPEGLPGADEGEPIEEAPPATEGE
jgi:hypothetical protein